MQKKFQSFVFILSIVTGSFLLISRVNAQDAATAPGMTAPPEIRSIESTEVKGEVSRIDGQNMTIQTDQGVKEVSVPQTVDIKRNSLESGVGDLKPGDDVTITQTPDGQVLSINAVAGEIFDYGKYILPLMIGLLLLAGLIWYTTKKANRSHIRTTVG